MHKTAQTHRRNLVDLIFPRRQQQDVDSLLEERCKRIFQLIDGINEKYNFNNNGRAGYYWFLDDEAKEINQLLEGISIRTLEKYERYGAFASFLLPSNYERTIIQGIYNDKYLKNLLDEKGIEVVRGRYIDEQIFKRGKEVLAHLDNPRLNIRLSYAGREQFLKDILKTLRRDIS